MFNEGLGFLKTKAKEASLSSYQNHNHNLQQHLSKKKFLTLKNLRKTENIVIQKSDNGNSVVIVDYLDKMKNFLNDTCKFEKIYLKNDGNFEFVVNQE